MISKAAINDALRIVYFSKNSRVENILLETFPVGQIETHIFKFLK
jgi:hypothetical protein